MKRILGIILFLGMLIIGYGSECLAEPTSLLNPEHWSLGFTAAYVSHSGDAVPKDTEFERGLNFRLPVAVSIFSPKPVRNADGTVSPGKGLRLSAFISPNYLTDTKFKNGSPGWDVGLAFGIWQGSAK